MAELLRCNPTICLYAAYGNADRPLDALWSVQPYEWKFFPFSLFAPRYTPPPSAFSFSALPAHRIDDHKTEQIVHQMQILKFHTKTPAHVPCPDLWQHSPHTLKEYPQEASPTPAAHP